MFNMFRRAPSQISPKTIAPDVILERGIDVLVTERNFHLSEMDRLSVIIHDAQCALDQHNRLYEALNNTLFAINHPFDGAPSLAIADDAAFIEALEMDFDLSVDHPTADEEQAAELVETDPSVRDVSKPLAPTPQELADAEPLDMPEPVVPLRRSRNARTAAH